MDFVDSNFWNGIKRTRFFLVSDSKPNQNKTETEPSETETEYGLDSVNLASDSVTNQTYLVLVWGISNFDGKNYSKDEIWRDRWVTSSNEPPNSSHAQKCPPK